MQKRMTLTSKGTSFSSLNAQMIFFISLPGISTCCIPSCTASLITNACVSACSNGAAEPMHVDGPESGAHPADTAKQKLDPTSNGHAVGPEQQIDQCEEDEDAERKDTGVCLVQ